MKARGVRGVLPSQASLTTTAARGASPPARRGADPGGRPPGTPRRRLTPEAIIAASLRLLDTDGRDGFSLPKLGRALGVDPTAVYRHFASKDDLVLAIADRLIEEAMDGFVAQPCWVDTIILATRRLRTTYLEHPAAAALSACRTTRRTAEMRTVDILIGAMLQAGFSGPQAAVAYRACGDFALAWAGGEANFLAMDLTQQQGDRAAWTRAYRAVDRAEHPNIWQIRDELDGVGDDAIFEQILAIVVTGLQVQAPNPCTCGAHRLGAGPVVS
jgi:AcrR family transcriptional regulator